MKSSEQNSEVQDSANEEIVRPLFCFDVSHKTYFKFFTIMLITVCSIDIIASLLFSFESFKFAGFAGALIDIPLLVLASISYVKFADHEIYGSIVNLILAIAVLTISYIVLLGSIIIPITLGVLGATGMLGEMLTNISQSLIVVGVSLFIFVFLPLLAYTLFLSHLYLNVIRARRQGGPKEISENISIGTEEGSGIAENKKSLADEDD